MFRHSLLISFLALTGCGIDSGESKHADCDRILTVSGTINSVDASSDDYEKQMIWFNTDAEDLELAPSEERIMEQLGLSVDDNDDVERFLYWLESYDLRMLLVEKTNERYPDTRQYKTNKNLSLFFFDLAHHNVQPNQEVEIFDISEIAELRGNEDKSVLASKVRQLIDEMRDNNKPDAIVGFSPDRSGEDSFASNLIVLFSPTAVYADSGTASFHDVHDHNGDPTSTVEYPSKQLDAMSMTFEAHFDTDTVDVQAECFGIKVYD